MDEEGVLCEMNTLWLLLPCCESVFTFNLAYVPEGLQFAPYRGMLGLTVTTTRLCVECRDSLTVLAVHQQMPESGSGLFLDSWGQFRQYPWYGWCAMVQEAVPSGP